MSKILSGILAVCLVLTGVCILGGVFTEDADSEGAYAKYYMEGEYDYEYPVTMNGTLVITINDVKDGTYYSTSSFNVEGTISAYDNSISDRLPSENVSDYKQGGRAHIGDKTVYIWTFTKDCVDYSVYSDKTLDLNNVYRMDTNGPGYFFDKDLNDITKETHSIIFTDGFVSSWTYTLICSYDSAEAEHPFMSTVPEGAEKIPVTPSSLTRFGDKEMVEMTDAEGSFFVGTNSGIVLKMTYNGLTYSLTSTNVV